MRPRGRICNSRCCQRVSQPSREIRAVPDGRTALAIDRSITATRSGFAALRRVRRSRFVRLAKKRRRNGFAGSQFTEFASALGEGGRATTCVGIKDTVSQALVAVAEADEPPPRIRIEMRERPTDAAIIALVSRTRAGVSPSGKGERDQARAQKCKTGSGQRQKAVGDKVMVTHVHPPISRLVRG